MRNLDVTAFMPAQHQFRTVHLQIAPLAISPECDQTHVHDLGLALVPPATGLPIRKIGVNMLPVPVTIC